MSSAKYLYFEPFLNRTYGSDGCGIYETTEHEAGFIINYNEHKRDDLTEIKTIKISYPKHKIICFHLYFHT